MFWNAEDIQHAADEAAKFIGRVGRVVPLSAQVVSSAVLYTQEHGKIWYGDIQLQQDANLLERLSAALEMPVFVLADTTTSSRIDVTDAIAVASKQGFQILRAATHVV